MEAAEEENEHFIPRHSPLAGDNDINVQLVAAHESSQEVPHPDEEEDAVQEEDRAPQSLEVRPQSDDEPPARKSVEAPLRSSSQEDPTDPIEPSKI